MSGTYCERCGALLLPEGDGRGNVTWPHDCPETRGGWVHFHRPSFSTITGERIR